MSMYITTYIYVNITVIGTFILTIANYLSSVVVNKSVSFPDLAARGTAFQKMVSAVIKEEIIYCTYCKRLYRA